MPKSLDTIAQHEEICASCEMFAQTKRVHAHEKQNMDCAHIFYSKEKSYLNKKFL
jgi:hypothetical protein